MGRKNISYEEVLSIARNALGRDRVIVSTQETAFGWIFYNQTEHFIKSGFNYPPPGGGPMIVDFEGGTLKLGTAPGIEKRIEDYENWFLWDC